LEAGRRSGFASGIGVSLQETELSERLTVLETLTLFRSFYPRGITPQEAMARALA
jgi:ABC-2 type transport system ATP-binding protein